MMMVTGEPCRRPASAMAWAWLPDENATTPRPRCCVVQGRDGVVGAAELERAGPLQVLAFEEQLAAGAWFAVREVMTGVLCAKPSMRRAARSTSP